MKCLDNMDGGNLRCVCGMISGGGVLILAFTSTYNCKTVSSVISRVWIYSLELGVWSGESSCSVYILSISIIMVWKKWLHLLILITVWCDKAVLLS